MSPRSLPAVCRVKQYPQLKMKVRPDIIHLDMARSVVCNGIHSQVLKEPADVTARWFFVIFESSWQSVETPDDWKKADITLVLEKDDSENCRPVSLTTLPGEVMEQTLLEAIS